MMIAERTSDGHRHVYWNALSAPAVFVTSRRLAVFALASLLAFLFVLGSTACGDEGTANDTVVTGNEAVDEVIAAMLNRDSETVLEYWNRLAAPCVAPTDEGFPRCGDSEQSGDLVREGASQCGVGAVRLDDLEIGVPDDWDVYSIELDERRGQKYTIVFAPIDGSERGALQVELRAPAPGLEDVIPFAFITYAETCESPGELTAAASDFILPPPHLR